MRSLEPVSGDTQSSMYQHAEPLSVDISVKHLEKGRTVFDRAPVRFVARYDLADVLRWSVESALLRLHTCMTNEPARMGSTVVSPKPRSSVQHTRNDASAPLRSANGRFVHESPAGQSAEEQK